MSLIQFHKRADQCATLYNVSGTWREGGRSGSSAGLKREGEGRGRHHWGGKNMKQRKWALFFTDIQDVVVSGSYPVFYFFGDVGAKYLLRKGSWQVRCNTLRKKRDMPEIDLPV